MSVRSILPLRVRRLFAGALMLVPLPLLTGCLGSQQDPDPVVQDFAVAYVKRPLPLDDEGALVSRDVREEVAFHAGGDLYVRDRASPGALERNVTFRVTGGEGDVKDVESSYDGAKFIFSLHLPLIEGADPEDQPTWNIWEYEIATDTLQRVIPSDTVAEAGQDVGPYYLPDGRVVFSSTRQRRSKALLLDEGKPQFSALDENANESALLLHVMNADGGDIKQISYNQSHDIDPVVLANGKIMFSRWDNMGGRDQISLYQVNPDGTGLEVLYGAHSHDTGTDGGVVQFREPREMSDGRVMALLLPTLTDQWGGDIVVADVARYADYNQPNWQNLGLGGTGQTPATANEVHTDGTPSPGGEFLAAYPLWDGTPRMLVSWSPCRLLNLDDRIIPCSETGIADPDMREAPPLYGLFIYDRGTNTQIPVAEPEEGMMITEVAAAQPRQVPAYIPDKIRGVDLNADYVDEGVGVLHIRSVYDFDGVDTAVPNIATLADPAQTGADQRPARFLRIVKSVAIPDDTVLEDLPGTAFGPNQALRMREIIGYAPVDPDGSVMVKVPADVPLTIDVLDKNGRRIGARHQNWLQLRPGEVKECNGCHIHENGLPHGQVNGPPPVNTGAPASGLPFPNTEPSWLAQMGETMAQLRTRITAAIAPAMDVVYDDVWTDANVRPKDTSFGYRYADLTTPIPVAAGCLTAWSVACRSIIHYETHIHPLWSAPRTDGGGQDRTCTGCHNVVDAMGAARVPAAQLDLSDGASDDQPARFKSYRELLFADNEQELAGGVLQDRLVPGTDAEGNPVMVPVRAQGPSMSAAGANTGYFLGKFDSGGTHAGWLSDAEKRLIAEWLDIGAQYYNDPFAVPQ